MAYVCSDLKTINETQTCVQWVEQQSLLPKLTYTEANSIGAAILLVFATVFVFNQTKNAIRRY